MTYQDNPLLQEIRKDHGTLGATFEGASEAPGTVQDQFRLGGTEGRESGGNTANSSNGSRTGNGTGAGSQRTAQGSDSGKGRTGTASDEDHSGAYSGNGSNNSPVPTTELGQKIAALYKANPNITYADASRLAGCSVTTATNYLKALRGNASEKPTFTTEEKPSGLAPKQHEKESAIRQEQQQTATGKAEPISAKGIFSLLSRGKGEKEDRKKDGIRNKPLSEREAEEIKEPLIAALMDYFKYADEFIYATHKRHAQVQIWSSIDEEECEALVDVWLGHAKRSAKAASQVVHVVNSHAQLKVGIILVPRFYQTFQVYMASGIGVR